MGITINTTTELLELIRNENITHELASKITTTYLNVLDLTTSKESLITRVDNVRDKEDEIKQFILLIDNGNPLAQ
jgi:hypothetical protein